MAQGYSGRLDKSNKAITAPKLSLHNLECWQINLRRCKAASYNMCEVTKNVRSGLGLAQEPWTYATVMKPIINITFINIQFTNLQALTSYNITTSTISKIAKHIVKLIVRLINTVS